jgi:hypothetical protein
MHRPARHRRRALTAHYLLHAVDSDRVAGQQADVF